MNIDQLKNEAAIWAEDNGGTWNKPITWGYESYFAGATSEAAKEENTKELIAFLESLKEDNFSNRTSVARAQKIDSFLTKFREGK